MQLQKLLSYVRRATDDYKMIEKDDKIAVALSGGKDSLALLVALKHLRRFYPKPYELCAITVSVGFAGFDFSRIEEFCEEIGVEHFVVKTDIASVVFEERKEKNPCSLCAKMRKGALNQKAKEQGCNKIALGHNKDDFLETFFMSLFYEGRLHALDPVSYLDRTALHMIRPLLYVSEKDIISYANAERLPVVKNPCPADGNTKREEMKRFIEAQTLQYDHFREKVFGAVYSKRELFLLREKQ